MAHLRAASDESAVVGIVARSARRPHAAPGMRLVCGRAR
ncbi:hypothetical protein T261_2972 [Streptomyces lydicus]|nr:hypothetical protein T261_2972 [Streptomyces lydicus]